MNKRIIILGISAMFLLWSCGSGNSRQGSGITHGHHDHETEEVHDHHDHENETGHDHEAELLGHEADLHAGHDHAAGEAGHSDEIVISPEKAAAVGIATETVTPGKFREIIHTSGEILPAAGDESTIVATTDGTVSFIENYTEGMAVGQDQEIFAILSGNLQDGNRIEKARIAYLTAKEEYERASKLTDSKIVSQKEFVTIKENYETARLAYEALKPSKSGNGVAVTAPFKGYIKSLTVKQGDYVTTGTPLATISQNSHLVLEADLSQKDYARRYSIAGANFSTAYSDHAYSTSDLGGKLLSIGRSQNEGEYYMPVSFSIRNTSDLVPGAFAEIWLLCNEKDNVITLPISAITEEQGLYFVYLKLDEQCYKKQEVILGPNDGRRTEILKGLKPGDNVVIKGAYNVKLASASNAIPAHTHNH